MRAATLVTGAGLRRLDPARVDDDARALAIAGDRIAWVGAPEDAPAVDRRVDVDGWITPAFVDAHVHATATGLAAEGLDLSPCRSIGDVLDAVRGYARSRQLDPILGTGWDDHAWPEGRPPSAGELGSAAPGRAVLLERVDSHSCVVDPATLAGLPIDRSGAAGAGFRPEDVDRDAAGRPTGWLKEGAAALARAAVYGALSPARLDRARQVACRQAAALGIGSFHEMGHPAMFGLDDALAWAAGEWPVDVQVWWAELDAEAASRHGMRCGGDLFLDGSIGSRTAAVSDGYRDADGAGALFHSDDAVTRFFVDATRFGLGAGVHAIGDRAIEQALAAIEAAARQIGVEAVRACRHRIEHVELPCPDHPGRMAALGVVASVQPAFDEAWGGATGLYASRFGAPTALHSNPFDRFLEAGVPMAFGSDSTVTSMGPWAGVAAAERHRGGHGIDRLSAWSVHTLGGRYVAGQDGIGPITEGARADFAMWDRDPLSVEDVGALKCLGTWVRGVRIHPSE